MGNRLSIGDFIEECESFPYSDECLGLYQESQEIDLMENYYFEDTNNYFLEAKKQGFFSSVAHGIGRVIRKCCKAMTRILVKVSDPISLDNIDNKSYMLKHRFTKADCVLIKNIIGSADLIRYQNMKVVSSKSFPKIKFDNEVDNTTRDIIRKYLCILFDPKCRIVSSFGDARKNVGKAVKRAASSTGGAIATTVGAISVTAAVETLPFFKDLANALGGYIGAEKGSSHKERVTRAKERVKSMRDINTPGTDSFATNNDVYDQFIILRKLINGKYREALKAHWSDTYDAEQLKELRDVLQRVEDLSKEFEKEFDQLQSARIEQNVGIVISHGGSAAAVGNLVGGHRVASLISSRLSSSGAITAKSGKENVKKAHENIENKLKDTGTAEEMADLVRKMTEMLGAVTKNNAQNVSLIQKARASVGKLSNLFNRQSEGETSDESSEET